MSGAAEKPMFYILLVKWSRGTECLVWWRPNASGYALDLNDAGTYDADYVDAACRSTHGDNVGIPVEVAQELSSRVVLDSMRSRLLAARRPTKET